MRFKQNAHRLRIRSTFAHNLIHLQDLSLTHFHISTWSALSTLGRAIASQPLEATRRRSSSPHGVSRLLIRMQISRRPYPPFRTCSFTILRAVSYGFNRSIASTFMLMATASSKSRTVHRQAASFPSPWLGRGSGHVENASSGVVACNEGSGSFRETTRQSGGLSIACRKSTDAYLAADRIRENMRLQKNNVIANKQDKLNHFHEGLERV